MTGERRRGSAGSVMVDPDHGELGTRHLQPGERCPSTALARQATSRRCKIFERIGSAPPLQHHKWNCTSPNRTQLPATSAGVRARAT